MTWMIWMICPTCETPLGWGMILLSLFHATDISNRSGSFRHVVCMIYYCGTCVLGWSCTTPILHNIAYRQVRTNIIYMTYP